MTAEENDLAATGLSEGTVRSVPYVQVEDGAQVLYGGRIWTYEGNGRVFCNDIVSVRIGGIELKDLHRLCVVYPPDPPEEVREDNYPVKYYPLREDQWARVVREHLVGRRVDFRVRTTLHCPATFGLGQAPAVGKCEYDGKSHCPRLICAGWTSYEAEIRF